MRQRLPLWPTRPIGRAVLLLGVAPTHHDGCAIAGHQCEQDADQHVGNRVASSTYCAVEQLVGGGAHNHEEQPHPPVLDEELTHPHDHTPWADERLGRRLGRGQVIRDAMGWTHRDNPDLSLNLLRG